MGTRVKENRAPIMVNDSKMWRPQPAALKFLVAVEPSESETQGPGNVETTEVARRKWSVSSLDLKSA